MGRVRPSLGRRPAIRDSARRVRRRRPDVRGPSATRRVRRPAILVTAGAVDAATSSGLRRLKTIRRADALGKGPACGLMPLRTSRQGRAGRRRVEGAAIDKQAGISIRTVGRPFALVRRVRAELMRRFSFKWGVDT